MSRAALLTLLMLLMLVPLGLWSLFTGYADIPLAALSGEHGDAPLLRQILLELRLPRTLLAMFIGAALGISGAALQGFLRNPLADAGILGVSAGAALGAVAALYYGLYALWAPLLPLSGLAGGGIAVLLVFLLSRQASVTTLILAGVAVNAFASAATALLLNLAPNPYAVMEIVFWMLGSLANRSVLDLWLAVPPILIGSAMLLLSARSLDALSLGDDAARSLGINLTRSRVLVLAGSAACVGAAVAVSGVIGFVGLVVPHLIRPLIGARPSQLLLPCAVTGAVLLLAADIVTRIIPAETELKLGVVTALLGAPFFLLLLLRLRRGLT